MEGFMGADPYWYYVPYEEDKNSALEKLKKREFEAGRYNFNYFGKRNKLLRFPIDETDAPGKGHGTIEEALEDCGECGTSSILDIESVSDNIDICVAYVVTAEEMREYLGTDKPTRNIIDEKIWGFWEYIANSFGCRGVGICMTVYENDQLKELYFGGYSFD